jgi:hypothetical protein
MRRFLLTALTFCFAVATISDAWAWGSVTGPRGGTAYRGAFGGTAVQGPRGGAAYSGPAGRGYARGPNGAAAYRGPNGAAVARGPNGNYAVRGPTAYNNYYGRGVVTPGVAAGVAAGVAVGTAAGAYASSSTSYYPSPYYCAFGDPSCATAAAPAEAAAGGGQAAGNAQTACRGDAQRLCPSAVAARDRATAQSCLIQNIDKTSAACHQALAAAGAAPAAAAAAPAPTQATSPASQPAADPQTACGGDAQKLCASAVAARDRAAAKSCLVQNIDKVSAPCHQALEQAMK